MIYVEQFWDSVYLYEGPSVDVESLRKLYDSNFPNEPRLEDYQPEYPLVKYNAAMDTWREACSKIRETLGYSFTQWLVKNHGFVKLNDGSDYISI